MNRVWRLFFLASLLFCLSAEAQRLDVRIFALDAITSIDLQIKRGHYRLVVNETVLQHLSAGEVIKISVSDGKTTVGIGKKIRQVQGSCSLVSKHEGVVAVKPGNTAAREYSGDLVVSRSNGKLLLINKISLEDYVAGVVQSEAGITNNEELYKAQSVICRTYALNDYRKHLSEGYNLCDGEHCQVYKYRCTKPDVLSATKATRNLVLTHNGGDLVTAAFHSNSGGQTVNSEDVWTHARPYLRAVNDSFSLGRPKSTWEFKIERTKWLTYLRDTFRLDTGNKSVAAAVTNFDQDSRKVFLTDSVPLKKIRRDLALPSTFFSISGSGDTLVFLGKGWGHGVGLSQQGALKMAELGYDYQAILMFYYTDVQILNMNKARIPQALKP